MEYTLVVIDSTGNSNSKGISTIGDAKEEAKQYMSSMKNTTYPDNYSIHLLENETRDVGYYDPKTDAFVWV